MICKRCKADKGAEFYANDSTCKKCRCALVRANRASKIDYYRAYDVGRAMSPKRVAGRAAYAATPRGAEVNRRVKIAWAVRNPEKRKSQHAVNNALRVGRLVRLPCEVCGKANTEAHHDDYSKPLAVRWLCTTHHKPADRERRKKTTTTA